MGNQGSKASFATRELIAASERGNAAYVKLLVERDAAEVNFQDQHGWTPLVHACSEGHEDVVAYLLEKGADVRQVIADGSTPLHLAITARHAPISTMLLDHGCDPNMGNPTGFTPLHLACLVNDPSIITLLIARGARNDARTSEGLTPRDYAKSDACVAALAGVATSVAPSTTDPAPSASISQLNHIQNNMPARPAESKGYISLQNDDDIPMDTIQPSHYGEAVNPNMILNACKTLSNVTYETLNLAQRAQLANFYRIQLTQLEEVQQDLDQQ
eukprot:TRINITY_DN5749_c0_g1_i2.p1 TRINITY_DN5749_c0_g1~~TRINITY_DN5749_c0_g1_i2.p1  ORF type:complete len:273 (+),score=49.51 TRINITY_DN5749_c0_g1_i2:149-967(+)